MATAGCPGGTQAEIISDFLEKGVKAVGWKELGDLPIKDDWSIISRRGKGAFTSRIGREDFQRLTGTVLKAAGFVILHNSAGRGKDGGIELLGEVYEKLDSEFKAMLPLKKTLISGHAGRGLSSPAPHNRTYSSDANSSFAISEAARLLYLSRNSSRILCSSVVTPCSL